MRGRSTTKAGPGLRGSIEIRRAGGRGGGRARASSRPVTVTHCGPVLKGEFARTVNMEGYSAGVHVHFRETIL